jgi:hypothetical protein
MIKTFRGQIADGGIDVVNIHTNNGEIGYRIIRFQIIGIDSSATSQESTVKIFTVPQTNVDSTIDLSSQTLLAIAYRENYSGSNNSDPSEVIIFDKMVFNQDLYITHDDATDAGGCNYYFELEQVKLDLNESTVATLRDIRNIKNV